MAFPRGLRKLLIGLRLSCCAAAVSSLEYVMRPAVRIGHVEIVRLASSGGIEQTFNVSTLSDDNTGLRAFMVDDVLSAEECAQIRTMASTNLEKSEVAREVDGLHTFGKKKKKRVFREIDEDRNDRLDVKEVKNLIRYYSDLVDIDYSEIVRDFVSNGEVATSASDYQRAITLKEFMSIDWSKYFSRMEADYPQRFSRHSSQNWLTYDESPVLKQLQQRVAAVTGLPIETVTSMSEALQVLHYAPNGSHYSCHHDTASEDTESFRFLTFLIFLNDVEDGGETVLFGTDLQADTQKSRRNWGEVEWSDLEAACQPTHSCPSRRGEAPPAPFSDSVVVQPRRGRAVFWYNNEVDTRGRGKRFVWSSIHGGCPTRAEHKWAANVWIMAGPALYGSESRQHKHSEL
eukprot:TRINITY_DN54875_c0_g1_i1.p1 TRINITY_DN54875_c0_g1~~TRINITY_DN54875_c0_g1_i1.p1  ORF type:complete len:402 (-),score=63.44 TRINITY_DN54875_c0_g1_i1:53-1258(-)